jgi:hypothetical protein
MLSRLICGIPVCAGGGGSIHKVKATIILARHHNFSEGVYSIFPISEQPGRFDAISAYRLPGMEFQKM